MNWPGSQAGRRRAPSRSAGARRLVGRRPPGAHRAGPPDGLVPGFGRARPPAEHQAPEPAQQPGRRLQPGDEELLGNLLSRGALAARPDLAASADLAQGDMTPPGSEPPPPPLPEPPGDGDGVASPSLVRSSGIMALGTLASRITGLLRTMVLAYALGALALANAYNYANTLPNTVYNLAIGGILTSVIVPLLVNAAKRNSDRGESYDQRMFTLVTVTLLGLTLAATALAAPIATLYDPRATGNERHLLIIFAYFFIPQIFFYGVSSLASAILNARGHFAAPMWTPVVNNIVVIMMAAAFMAVAGFGSGVEQGSISTGEVILLGVGTTLGIVAQTVALVPAMRKVGFRWRPRFDFRRREVREIGRMSGWMFGYVLTTQVAYLVTAIVASTADHWADVHHYPVGIGITPYSYAWLLFQLPYAVVGISVITALLPRMSAHASDRKYDLVRSDFSTGVRLGSVIVAPASLILAALGPALAEVMLAWGNTSDASARYLGLVFSIFSLGLMPYMLFQLLLRVFYALHDSKTPAMIGVVTMVINVAANLIALAIFPPTHVVAALGAGFGLANLAGSVLAWRVLGRRLGGLAGREIGASLLRMHAAVVPGAFFALALAVMMTGVFSSGKVAAALVVLLGGGGALVLYVMFARALRVAEVTSLLAIARSRLGR